MSQTTSKYLVAITPEHATQGRVGRSVVLTGEQLQFACIYLQPGAEIPWHSHPNETMVTVIAGGYDLWIGDDHMELKPGFAVWVPGNAPHRAVVGSELTIELEAFAPPRDDYAERTPHANFRKLYPAESEKTA